MSDSRLLLLAALLLLAVFGLVAGIWVVARLVLRRLARRWPSVRSLVHWSQRIATRALVWAAYAGAIYFVVIALGFLSTAPWRVDSRWRNTAALAALPPLKQRPFKVAFVSQQLLERLKTTDTLLLVALSGGGSRAAYFSASLPPTSRRIGHAGRTPLTRNWRSFSPHSSRRWRRISKGNWRSTSSECRGHLRSCCASGLQPMH